jgi:hypothetical protein
MSTVRAVRDVIRFCQIAKSFESLLQRTSDSLLEVGKKCATMMETEFFDRPSELGIEIEIENRSETLSLVVSPPIIIDSNYCSRK